MQSLNLQFKKQSKGFTILELLIVLTIIAILVFLLIPVGASIKERANRAKCRSNIKYQLAAMFSYAAEHEFKEFYKMPRLANGLPASNAASYDGAPESLYPEYISDVRLFLCPSTNNAIDLDKKHPTTGVLMDLKDNAPGHRLGTSGHSYEYFGCYGGVMPQLRIKSPHNDIVTAARTVLIVDADDDFNVEGGINNYPTPANNHGDAGWNWGYADGHVEWITPEETPLAFQRSSMAGGD